MQRELYQAIQRGALEVHYQPRVRLDDLRIVGFEALARWEHAELGWISPGEFIPIAEEFGLIGLLGDRILERAVQEAASWTGDGEQPPFVSVNVSPLQLDGGGFAADVRRTLERCRLAPERLALEITEASVLDRSHLDELSQLVSLGIPLDLDDFGTGYSSLGYLAEFPLSGLKIDRSLVRDLEDRRRESIVRAILGVANALTIEVTAEGIESDGQRKRLTDLGCECGQSFLFERPMPDRDARALLTSNDAVISLS